MAAERIPEPASNNFALPNCPLGERYRNHRLAREPPGDDVTWLHLEVELAFLRGDFSSSDVRVPAVSGNLTNATTSADRRSALNAIPKRVRGVQWLRSSF
jgi:hypothetical protein